MEKEMQWLPWRQDESYKDMRANGQQQQQPKHQKALKKKTTRAAMTPAPNSQKNSLCFSFPSLLSLVYKKSYPPFPPGLNTKLLTTTYRPPSPTSITPPPPSPPPPPPGSSPMNPLKIANTLAISSAVLSGRRCGPSWSRAT
jgi:hypothetical protein